ncbi:hypothetical protein TNCV_3085281 [Trichonephila clavipes]|nr:hypothetical protein TNCV_3085281 [Trichonephila clavipes]
MPKMSMLRKQVVNHAKNEYVEEAGSGSTWILEVVSIPVHVHQLDSIGNETRQTRQRVSSQQQSNVDGDTCWWPSIKICSKLWKGLMILVSRRWSRSCMIIFWPQLSRIFDVLLDSRYSWYTRGMTIRENPNFIVTDPMAHLLRRL